MDNFAPIKFSQEFTTKAQAYLTGCIRENKTPTIKEFGLLIGVTEETVFAWADKKKKDETGAVTAELARPNFNEVVYRIQKGFTLEEKKETKELVEEKVEKIVEETKKLNPKQELFCQLYATNRDFFGNGVDSYVEAYDIDQSKPNWYHTAAQSAYRLLTNVEILKRIDELMELGPLNDTVVDKQLAFVIAQNADLGSKVAAMREYNKLKARIIEKIDHTTKGKEMPTPIYGGRSTD